MMIMSDDNANCVIMDCDVIINDVTMVRSVYLHLHLVI